MIDRIRVYATNDGDVVGNLCGVRQKITDPGTAGTMLLEAEAGGDNREVGLRRGHPRQSLAVANALRQILVGVLD